MSARSRELHQAGRHLVTVTATDGGGLSREVSFFIDILKPVVDAIDTPETKELPKREINKPKEKRPELNPHDLPPVMKVAAKPNEIGKLPMSPISNRLEGLKLRVLVTTMRA